MLQTFSDGLAKLCDERFEALLAEPRGKELLDPHLQTAGLGLDPPAAALQGSASFDASDANKSAEEGEAFDIG